MTGAELGLILCAAATYETFVMGASYLIEGAVKATRTLRRARTSARPT
jgi:hypothetical protein